jgi:hypothetical protein
MRWPLVALAAIMAGCAHRASPVLVVSPHPVVKVMEIAPPRARRIRECPTPPAPKLPDNATAPSLPIAIDRLTARDELRADYERRLLAALKACVH